MNTETLVELFDKRSGRGKAQVAVEAINLIMCSGNNDDISLLLNTLIEMRKEIPSNSWQTK